MRRRLLIAGVVLAAAGLGACGDDGSGGDGGSGGNAAAGMSGGGGMSARAGAGASAGGGAGEGGAGAGANAGAGAGGGAGEGGSGGFTEMGVCGQRGRATADESQFSGYLEHYLIGEEGFGDDICVVRFDAMRVGEAPGGCVDPADDTVPCRWTHLVELGTATVMTDQNGVCANSELGLDDDALAQLEGSQVGIGFVKEFAGHDSVAMRYDDATSTWKAFGNGTWDEDAGMFRFDYRDGFCDY